jgi:hypothetical protein
MKFGLLIKANNKTEDEDYRIVRREFTDVSDERNLNRRWRLHSHSSENDGMGILYHKKKDLTVWCKEL